jgi:hypothetical protein
MENKPLVFMRGSIMDKDNLDLESLLTHFNADQFSSPQKDVPQKEPLQKLLVALFFMAIGVILVATGFISLLWRVLGLVHFPVIWLRQRIKHRSANYKTRFQQIRS